MADPTQQQHPSGVPAGVTLSPVGGSAPASPAPQGVPAGVTLTPVDGAGGEANTDNQGPERGTIENLACGFMKGAAKTVTGITDLAARALSPKGSTMSSKFEDNVEQPSVARNAGQLSEDAGEFMTGDAALDAGLTKAMSLVKASKLSPLLMETLKIAQKHPLIARMIESGAKGAAVGGAQGAAKGAAEGDAAGGA